MAKIPFLVVHGCNLYVEGLSTHLALETAKLPVHKETFEEFTPAGANGAIEVAVSREACMLGFRLKGLHPDLMGRHAKAYGQRDKITIYAALVDEYAGGAPVPVVATAYGRLGSEADEMGGGNLTGVDYELKSISKYTLTIADREICRFNIELGGWVDGEGQAIAIARMLGITG